EVHPDLADGDDARVAREIGETRERVDVPRRGPMWMHTDGHAYVAVLGGEGERLLARGDVLRRREDSLHAGLPRALEHVGEIAGETTIGEMCMRVDHGGRVTFTDGGAHLCRGGVAVHERAAPSRACRRVRRSPRRLPALSPPGRPPR